MLFRYVFLSFAIALIYLTMHFSVCLFLTSPISAEYWVRELIIVKKNLVKSMSTSPRIIFLGGSSTLLGIDAQDVTAETGLAAMNMGLHAEVRLDQVRSIGREVLRQGDVLVLPLEHNFYSCDEMTWDDWQLRNTLAWNRSYFNSLSFGTRIKAVFEGGGTDLMMDLLASKLRSIADPEDYAGRLKALAPAEVIWARYTSGEFRTSDFRYSAYNIDDRGDMLGNNGTRYSGSGVPANQPKGICPAIIEVLTNFVSILKKDNVRTLIAHTPYLISDIPTHGWQEAEKDFQHDIKSTDATLIDRRDELFFPRPYFFDTELHLNDLGRHEWTKTLIADLRKLGIGRSEPMPALPLAAH